MFLFSRIAQHDLSNESNLSLGENEVIRHVVSNVGHVP